jgi:hypothetical protein
MKDNDGDQKVMSRRLFLKGLVGVAVTAAVISSPTLEKILNEPETAAQMFRRLAKTGVIKGHTFYLDEALYLTEEFNGLLITDCRFVMTTPCEFFIETDASVKNITITNNVFEAVAYNQLTV